MIEFADCIVESLDLVNYEIHCDDNRQRVLEKQRR